MTTALDVYNALSPAAPQSGQSGASIAGGQAAAALLAAIAGGSSSSGVSAYAPVRSYSPGIQQLTFVKGWSATAPQGGLAGIR
jgi:hypothetical protein